MGAKPEEDEDVVAYLASSSAISRARHMREVRGMRCCLVACWADVKRSHSKARACARRGFVMGRVTMALVVGWRRGRVSRKIWYAPGWGRDQSALFCAPLRQHVPSTSLMVTSCQKRFLKGVVVLAALAPLLLPAVLRSSLARRNSSACFRRLSILA